MKKLSLLTVALFLGTLTLFAQDTLKRKYFIPKGTYVCNAGVNFFFSKDQPQSQGIQSSYNLNINSRHGDFIAKNLALGFQIAYGYSNDKFVSQVPWDPYYYKSKSHTLGAGIFLRYYKMFTPKFGFFGEFNTLCSVQYRRSSSANTASNSRDYYIGLNSVITPNLVYFVTPKLAIEGSFGSLFYNYRKDLNSSANSHSGSFSVRPDLSIGMSLYFGKGVQSK